MEQQTKGLQEAKLRSSILTWWFYPADDPSATTHWPQVTVNTPPHHHCSQHAHFAHTLSAIHLPQNLKCWANPRVLSSDCSTLNA